MAQTKRTVRRTGSGSAKARRRAARLTAVQALYQIELAGEAVETVVREFIDHRIGQDLDGEAYVPADPTLFSDIVRGASVRHDEIDRLLGTCLDPQWPIERLELLLRAILRGGGFEILAHADTHPRILINEYVEVAHAFFAGREPGMVNGVLDKLARLLRPEELAQPDPHRVEN
ncbi:MAG: transcription antitermination factor NusB [Azospirillaceae bacterium]|nr:transcription antitermination factor NusB [Azospirillaceae bacterium]